LIGVCRDVPSRGKNKKLADGMGKNHDGSHLIGPYISSIKEREKERGRKRSEELGGEGESTPGVERATKRGRTSIGELGLTAPWA